MRKLIHQAVGLARASVPVAYVLQGLELAEALGQPRGSLLAGAGFDPALLEQSRARIPLAACARLVTRVWRATGNAALGYEFGLRLNLAAHGNLGYGLMSQRSFREALDFGIKYGALRNPVLRLSLKIEDGQAVVELREAVPLGPMRQYAIDAVLVSLARMGRQIAGAFRPEMELRFACAEPAHFERYRQRLPPVRFRAGVNQLRFPAAYLDRRMHTGDPVAARAAAGECERELSLIDDAASMVERVRAQLAECSGRYPPVDEVARRLHVSARTLKRHLQQEGSSFLLLLDEARERDSLRLLADRSLSVAEVAGQLGYANPASFTRAFRKWVGATPSGWRTREA